MSPARDNAVPAPLPPLLFPSTTSGGRRDLARLRASGRIRAVGPRLFASVAESETAETIRRSWSTIVAQLYPGALLTHRTALEFMPTPEGEVFFTSSTTRSVEYPGLTLRFAKGPLARADDPPFLTLQSSSVARAMLENLSHKRSARGRVLSIDYLEARLEKLLHVDGKAALYKLRDDAARIADELGWRAELRRLEQLIGALSGTRPGAASSAIARARAAGEPFDPRCLERLDLLFAELRAPLPDLPQASSSPDHFRNKAFFEAYFSNYIEGTTFEIGEAEAIAFDGQVPENRPADAHDFLGTFELVSDLGEMSRSPDTFDDFLTTLRAHHAKIMARRPETLPGQFKTATNRAGNTVFVAPEYVRGTMRKGWELSRDLARGLPRAIFLFFLVSDVHPFVDGNGRVARIMLNAELVAAGKATIIIPTVFREDYLLSLRALTRRNRPTPLVTALARAQSFSRRDFSRYPEALAEITRRNWFAEHDEAKIVD